MFDPTQPHSRINHAISDLMWRSWRLAHRDMAQLSTTFDQPNVWPNQTPPNPATVLSLSVSSLMWRPCWLIHKQTDRVVTGQFFTTFVQSDARPSPTRRNPITVLSLSVSSLHVTTIHDGWLTETCGNFPQRSTDQMHDPAQTHPTQPASSPCQRQSDVIIMMADSQRDLLTWDNIIYDPWPVRCSTQPHPWINHFWSNVTTMMADPHKDRIDMGQLST